MKRLFVFLLAGIAVINSACTYSESGIYRVDPVPGEPPTISVSTNLDTVVNPWVFDSLEIAYDVKIENGELYRVEAYIADQLVYNSDTTHDAFWINSNLVEPPTLETLFLFFLFSTNSNSLADIVGAEYDLLEVNFSINF